MKLSLQEMADAIDNQIGKLSPIISTEKVIKNKFKLAFETGRVRHVKAQKRRSRKTWIGLLFLTGCITKKA